MLLRKAGDPIGLLVVGEAQARAPAGVAGGLSGAAVRAMRVGTARSKARRSRAFAAAEARRKQRLAPPVAARAKGGAAPPSAAAPASRPRRLP